MAARYAATTDLMIGTLVIGRPEEENAVKDQFINIAADEIDAELALEFVLPLVAAPPLTAIPAHTTLMLKRANAFIASGRLLMDRGAAGSDAGIDSYAEYLLREGRDLLMALLNSRSDLGLVKIEAQVTAGNTPSIQHGDSTSGVDAFYAF